MPLPPHWLFFVQPTPQMPGSKMKELLEFVRDERIPGLSLMMHRGLADADLAALEGADALEYLNLARTNLTEASMTHVRRLKGLVALDLRGIPAMQDSWIPRLGTLTKLRALNLSGNMGLTDLAAAYLGRNLKSLVWLDLTGANIRDGSLAYLTATMKLQVLDLSQCGGVTDEGMKVLAKLKALEYLGLESLPITDRGLKNLSKRRGLRGLNLGMTRVSESGMDLLKTFGKLEHLDLDSLPIGGKGLKSVGGLKELRCLNLGGTRVMGSDLKAIRGLSNLVDLRLSGASIDDEAAGHIGKIKSLKRLYLHHGAALTDKGVARLANLKELETLGLAGAAKLTDVATKTLLGFTRLKWLDLSGCTGISEASVTKIREALPGIRVTGPRDRQLRPNSPAVVKPR